ncbi:hypothetical protein [Undibacterium sp. Xuan67W]|uniref:hypothetical protein n=1 Tax=Undibacterium sp. Xuan67W TaxID=3413057 RepID=UPI003BF002D1
MLSTNPEFFETPAKANQPELLVSAVLHLMSHYTVSTGQNKDDGACLKLASVIERHLKILAELPELGPVLKATCLQLSEQWAILVEHSLSRQGRVSLFERLVSGNR